MKKQISIAVKNELTVKIENKFPHDDVSGILLPLDYLKRTEIEECLENKTWELFTSCINRKFKETKFRAVRMQ
ncbi:MAG TPA: hypothetical protein PLJ60_05810 [Chryseolinea sp.]|nr:hypothetical protein [Chryseolinea sp.]HPH46871.1 hypothetical protein [Chryseolinea sp.]HPM29834.1 hypothetical protein [Chryseolinea sp.]